MLLGKVIALIKVRLKSSKAACFNLFAASKAYPFPSYSGKNANPISTPSISSLLYSPQVPIMV